MPFLHRHKGLTPYLLLLPGIVWLTLFFVAPLGFLGYQSLQTGTFDTGYTFDWAFSNYWNAISDYNEQFVRSFVYAGIATILALLVSYPLVYWIAFRAGRWKNVFLILMAYYILKTVREALILGEGTAELKSYLSAGQVAVLAHAAGLPHDASPVPPRRQPSPEKESPCA